MGAATVKPAAHGGASGPSAEQATLVWTRGLTGVSLAIGRGQAQAQVKLPPSETLTVVPGVYNVGEVLGSGTFGTVCPGVHLATGTKCVVKRVQRKDIDESYYIPNFVTRNDVFSKLLAISQERPHKNVVQYLDFLLGPSTIYVVMEPLNGEELFDYIIKHAPVTEAFCMRTMRQALAAARHIHECGLIHRDVKLESFRFRSQGSSNELVLFDFGLCVPVAEPSKDCVGTLLYLAPEVRDGVYDTQVDLWCLGVMLYVMMMGTMPFEEFFLGRRRSEAQWKKAVAALFKDEVLAEAPSFARELLAALLVHDPQARITAAEALKRPWFTDSTDDQGGETPKKRTLSVPSSEMYAAAKRRSSVAPSGRMARTVDEGCACWTGVCRYIRGEV